METKTNQNEKPKSSQVAIPASENQAKQVVFKAQKQFEASNEYQMNFVREASFAIQILTANSFLASTDPNSIRSAVVNVALTGLTLNPALKYAYLVPRAGKCILDISYMGMIKLLTDAGSVKSVDAAVIYANDEWNFKKGTSPELNHQPKISDRGEKIGVYAIAYFRDGGSQFEVLGRDEIQKVRATSESFKNEKTRKYSPWETWEDEMWKKTALKRLFKLLPKTKMSDGLVAALSVDNHNEVTDIVPVDDKYERVFDDIEIDDETK